MPKFLLRTSLRICRCAAGYKNVDLFEVYPTAEPPPNDIRLVPYRKSALPADVKPEDIERRIVTQPLAVCPQCIDKAALYERPVPPMTSGRILQPSSSGAWAGQSRIDRHAERTAELRRNWSSVLRTPQEAKPPKPTLESFALQLGLKPKGHN